MLGIIVIRLISKKLVLVLDIILNRKSRDFKIENHGFFYNSFLLNSIVVHSSIRLVCYAVCSQIRRNDHTKRVIVFNE
jgi:hypothetical protein